MIGWLFCLCFFLFSTIVIYYLSSLSLDQIDCRNGEDEKEEICGSMPATARCDFNDGDCGFKNMRRQNGVIWRQIKGPTPTDSTGPTRDHSHIKSAIIGDNGKPDDEVKKARRRLSV